MKKSIRKFVAMICCLTGVVALTGCSSVAKQYNTIPEAYEKLYNSNFTYSVSSTKYDINDELITFEYVGEHATNPYVEHKTYPEGQGFWQEIYYYGNGPIVSYKGLCDGEWLSDTVQREYFNGYGEEITVTSVKEETVDGVKYTVYNAKYSVEAGAKYGLSESIEATVTQQYFLEKENGQLVRIVSELTGLNRMTAIANDMSANGVDLETAQKNVDAAGKFEETVEVRIQYEKDDYKIVVPENASVQ